VKLLFSGCKRERLAAIAAVQGPVGETQGELPGACLAGSVSANHRLGTRHGVDTPYIAAWPNWPASETNQHLECTRSQRRSPVPRVPASRCRQLGHSADGTSPSGQVRCVAGALQPRVERGTLSSPRRERRVRRRVLAPEPPGGARIEHLSSHKIVIPSERAVRLDGLISDN
jgi:hypothetical protein